MTALDAAAVAVHSQNRSPNRDCGASTCKRDYVITLRATTDFTNKITAVLATNGFEDFELTSPTEAVKDAGATVHVIFTEDGPTEGKSGTKVNVDKLTSNVSADDHDTLVSSGGTVNANQIRIDKDTVVLVKGFIAASKPTGVICHGGWTLTDADALKGHTIIFYVSVRTNLVNAGADRVDGEVVIDGNLISSRTPADLEAFNKTLVENF